jgi:hypothetical protein
MMRLAEWENVLGNLDAKILEIHECPKNVNDTVGVMRFQYEDYPQDVWMLVTVWIAGNEEVLDGQADFIGQLKSSSETKIDYCPFCGQQLRVGIEVDSKSAPRAR